MDISFIISALYVVDVLLKREEDHLKKQELYQLKQKTILKLQQKKLAESLGLYQPTRSNDLVVVYRVSGPDTPDFYFFLLPTEKDLTLPLLEKRGFEFCNPKPKYVPALYYAVAELEKYTLEPPPKKRKNRRKSSIKQNRSIFVCRYLDDRQPFRPYY
ncbi:hypothetical protein BKP35_12435 [Anaerobacillus arseniciselenatis]|uniref:Uncharacterized protein n=1 Tax=Anaerobacillus arseniciselenatis TaxID=85682 RepID=A0A1S2LF18_9BACI|nr:YkyB family protein [Anaerobacillus arseniciselenatis]OIJ11119.1 hypothetical protein BKP35_12435 [Anaerobacillus arseniciselenatis]